MKSSAIDILLTPAPEGEPDKEVERVAVQGRALLPRDLAARGLVAAHRHILGDVSSDSKARLGQCGQQVVLSRVAPGSPT